MEPLEILRVSGAAAVGLAIVFVTADRARVALPATVSYLLHLVAALGGYAVLGLWAPDAKVYDDVAWTGSTGRLDQPLPFGKEGWAVLLSIVYRLFGHLPQVGLVLNVLAAALTTVVIAMIARRLVLPVTPTAWFAALLPSGILWSSLLLRESFTWLFMGLAVLGFAGLATRRSWGIDAIYSIVGLLGLLQFRGTAAVIVGAAGVLGVLIARRAYVPIAFAVVAAVPALLSPLGAPVRDILGQYSVSRLIHSQIALNDEASTAFPIDNPLSVVAHVLIGPPPWAWSVVGPVLALDAVIWVVVMAAAFRGALIMENRRLAVVVLLPALLLLASLAVTSGNYGTMQRLRVQPELLLLPFAAHGISTLRRGRTARVASSSFDRSGRPLSPGLGRIRS